MTDISELIERVKAATGPDRVVDLYVHARIAQAGEWSNGDIRYALMDIEGTTAPPAYTASVDAALALVERVVPGKAVLMGYGQTDGTKPWARIGEWHDADATGDNLALAIILALLLSLQSEADK